MKGAGAQYLLRGTTCGATGRFAGRSALSETAFRKEAAFGFPIDGAHCMDHLKKKQKHEAGVGLGQGLLYVLSLLLLC